MNLIIVWIKEVVTMIKKFQIYEEKTMSQKEINVEQLKE